MKSYIYFYELLEVLDHFCLLPSWSQRGLDWRDSGKLDDMTIFLFHNGMSLIWDSTCYDTCSSSNLVLSANNSGFAAWQAEKKLSWYWLLSHRFVVEPAFLVPRLYPCSLLLGQRLGCASPKNQSYCSNASPLLSSMAIPFPFYLLGRWENSHIVRDIIFH